MSALLLGFVIGAVFYVFGGRDSALGDLELPQRLGLVAVVGVVLLLVSMSFDLVDGWFASRYQRRPSS